MHGTPEPGVQGSSEPCCAKVGTCIEIGKWLGALETHELAEVAGDVEVEEGQNESLPCCKTAGESLGKTTKERWAMLITPGTM